MATENNLLMILIFPVVPGKIRDIFSGPAPWSQAFLLDNRGGTMDQRDIDFGNAVAAAANKLMQMAPFTAEELHEVIVAYAREYDFDVDALGTMVMNVLSGAAKVIAAERRAAEKKELKKSLGKKATKKPAKKRTGPLL